MTKKVLVYSPYGEWHFHGTYDITFGHGLRVRGVEIKYIACDGCFSDCDVHWDATSPREDQSCQICAAFTQALCEGMQMPFEWLSQYLPEEIWQQALAWVSAIPDADLITTEFEGYPLGKWVKSSVHSHYRMNHLDIHDARVSRAYRSYLAGAYVAFHAAVNLLDEFRPDALVMLNGRFFSHRVFFELAHERGIRVLVHERGARVNTLRFWENESCHGYQTFIDAWNAWKDVPLDEKQLQQIRLILDEREHGKNTNWKSFAAPKQDLEQMCNRLDIPAGSKVVSMYTSSDDEMAASEGWETVMDQMDWIKRSIRFFNDHPDYTLVIRIHPNTAGINGSNEQFVREIDAMIEAGLPGNVRIITAQEKINSYQLMDLSERCVVFSSTVSLEAAARGRPVLMTGGGWNYGHEFTENLVSESEYENTLERFLAKRCNPDEVRYAIRFAYHQFCRYSMPFPLVEMVEVFKARNTYTSLEELLPGRDRMLDKVCEFLMNGKPVYDVPEKSLKLDSQAEDREVQRRIPAGSLQDDAVTHKQNSFVISVIIPTYNRSAILVECLDALAAQTFPVDRFEVIVCDDGSTDETEALMKAYQAPYAFKYLRQENAGPAKARNTAIKAATGEYVLILNDDAIADRELLACHFRCHKELNDKNVSVIGSFNFKPELVDNTAMWLMQNSDVLFQYINMKPNQFYDFGHFWTCNISLRRSAFDEVGLFNESFKEAAGEDIEIGYRLQKIGFRIFYSPECITEHHHKLTFNDFMRRQVMVSRNAVLIARLHPEIAERVTGLRYNDFNEEELQRGVAQWLASNESATVDATEKLRAFEDHGELTDASLATINAVLPVFNTYWIYQGFMDGFWRFGDQAGKAIRSVSILTPGTTISGGVKIIFEYCNRLAERGYRVNLVALSGEYPDWFSLHENVQYIRTEWNDTLLLQAVPDSDAVFATHWLTAYFVARLPARKGKKFYLVQDYESNTIAEPALADPTYLLPLQKITVSTWIQDLLVQKFHQRSITVPNAIDHEHFYPQPEIRSQFPSEQIRIGMLFHYEERKRVQDGIQAIEQLKAEYPGIQLILFGTTVPDGDVGDEVYQNLDQDGVRQLLNTLDIFLSCSQYEGFGLPGLEAMACGIPLVTTDSGGVLEYAAHEETALVIQPGDIAAIQSAIRQMIRDKALRHRLVQNGLAKAAQFTWENALDRMEACLGNPVNPVNAVSRKSEHTSREKSAGKVVNVAVLSMDDPRTACAQLRLIQPLGLLGENVCLHWPVRVEGNQTSMDEKAMDDADVIIMQRFFPFAVTDELLNRVLGSGKPVYFEIDDLLSEIPASNPHHEGSVYIKQKMAEVLPRVNGVITSTQRLATRFSEFAKHVYVQPNVINRGYWSGFRTVVQPNDKVVIAYLATPTHIADLKIAEKALLRIAREYGDQVELVFMGCISPALRQLPNARYVDFEYTYDAYLRQLNSMKIDIAIAPLERNEFNDCKSNIKWLEYAYSKIAGIFTRLPAYEDIVDHETGLLVDNTDAAWYEALKQLVDSEELRNWIAGQAYDAVINRFTDETADNLYRDLVETGGIVESRAVSVAEYGKAVNTNDAVPEEPVQTSAASAKEKPDDKEMTQDKKYELWVKQSSLTEIDVQILAERMYRKWRHQPEFLMVCFAEQGDTDAVFATIESLSQQFYKKWHLSIVSSSECPSPASFHSGNIQWLQHQGARVDAANQWIYAHQADWVILLSPGTVFEAHALMKIADYINERPAWDLLYTDHDQIDQDGKRQSPWFKPDFDPEYLVSMDYIGNTLAIKRAMLLGLGGYSEHTGYENYDLLFRNLRQQASGNVGHIEGPLLHLVKTDVVPDEAQKKEILQHHFEQLGQGVEILQGFVPGTHRIVYRHTETPLVSIIIPTKDLLEYLEPCVSSILEKTSYRNYEIILVDNGSEDKDVFLFYEQLKRQYPGKVQVISYPFEFNYSAMINLGVRQAKGEYVLQLNNDTQVIQVEWLERMMTHAQRPEVGIVGAKLMLPSSGRIQHAGVVLGLEELAGHPYIELLDLKEPGYMNRAQVNQQYSAVTGACLLARKTVYEDVGGMDEVDLRISFNDIDLCLKVRDAGYHIVWTPYAVLQHHGRVSQLGLQSDLMREAKNAERFAGEKGVMLERWADYFLHDPAHNKHLSISENFPQPDFSCVINWYGPTKERPRIVGTPLFGGSGEYRVRAPLRAIARQGLAQVDYALNISIDTQRVLSPTELIRTEADTILVQAYIGNPSLQALEKYKRYTDKFVVFTLDDLLTNLPDGNSFKQRTPRNARTRLRKALQYVDRMIVSTEPLREYCQNMIDDIVVLPNMLEEKIWGDLVSERGISSKPRVGWAGAQQHAGDLAFLEEVVRQTADEVDWIFFGMCPDEVRPYVREVHDYELDFEKYAKKLASLDLDLAVAPLEIHPFNEAKSNLRLLEYGVMGWPVICTDIYPYQGAPVKRVKNNVDAWLNAIRERVHDLDAAYREGDLLRDWVKSNFMLDANARIWANSLFSGKVISQYASIWDETGKLIRN